MGQKTSPVGLRLQINRTWDSRWFAEGQDYGRLRQRLEDVLADLEVLEQQPPVVLAFRKPAAVPGTVDLQAQTDGVRLLTH